MMKELSQTLTDFRLREFPVKPLVESKWQSFLRNFYSSFPQYDCTKNIFVELSNGIGDQVCILGLLTALRDAYKPKHLFLFARKSSKDLISLFSVNIDKIIWFEESLGFSGEGNPYNSIYNTLIRPTKAHILNGRMNPIFTQYSIPYVDQYRIGLGLPLTANFNPPASSIIPKSDRNGAVILFPYSNTWPTAPIEFWIFISEKLKSAGISVYTNIINKLNNASLLATSKIREHEPIEGTLPLSLNLPELLAESNTWRGWVSGVSGPAWLLSHSQCKKIVVHRTEVLPALHTRRTAPSPIRLIDIDRVSSNFPTESISDYEFEIRGEFNTKIVDDIIDGY